MFVTKTHQAVLDVQHQMEKIYTALVVSDPKASLSAEAYEGLRRQVGMSASSRMSHLVQLAQMNEHLERTSDLAQVKLLVDEWMQQAGVVPVAAGDDPRLFQILAGTPGQGQLEVLRPAYVDRDTGALIQQGQAEWVVTEPEHSGLPAAGATVHAAGDPGGQAESDLSSESEEVAK